MQGSTFGQVLVWVRNQLVKVERNTMNNNQLNRSQCVSQARSTIDTLCKSTDAVVINECNKAAEAEYATLVALLKKTNIPITPELRQLAQEILNR